MGISRFSFDMWPELQPHNATLQQQINPTTMAWRNGQEGLYTVLRRHDLLFI